MKLTIFKGICHDLSDHLNFLIFSGQLTEFPLSSNILEAKDKFDELCLDFVRERVPKTFNFNRIKKVFISISVGGYGNRVITTIDIDDKIFSNNGNNKNLINN